MRDEVGIILCDTRRARQWRTAFARQGIAATIAETKGDESERGACKVSVARRDAPAANALVTAVTRGEQRLPGGGLSWLHVAALVTIAAIAAALASGRW